MKDRRLGFAACAGAVMLLFAAALGGTAHGAGPAVPTVEAASVRAPLAPGRPGAGYFTLKGGAQPERLVGASSVAAQRVELHRSAMAGGVMRMEAVAGVDLPAGGTLRFEPGGYHLMLFGLKPGVTQAPITLRFASGRTATATATVAQPAKAGADAMEHMNH